MTDHSTHPPAVHAQSGAWLPDRKLAEQVASRFGTPAFVYDVDYMRRNFHVLRTKFTDAVDLLYSLKANPNAAIVDCLKGYGAGAEVSSHAELHTAIRVGVDPQSIIFVGPAKAGHEIADCIRFGIFAIVAESKDELHIIDSLAADLGEKQPVNVMLRVNPDFNSGGSGLTMSGKPRQFGIDVEQIPALRPTLARLALVKVIGFHMYMGTRYLEAAPIVENAENILALSIELACELGIMLKAVDVGGGFGVPYFSNESPLDTDAVAEGVNAAVSRFRHTHPQSRVIIELGRYLTAGCGAMVTTVRYKKVSRGETFAIVDGGTNLHMAAVGLGGFAKRAFPIVNLTRPVGEVEDKITVTGPLCTPSDTLARKSRLGNVQKGDILAVLCSGAYGPSASPTGFLSHGYPNEVLVDGENLHLIRARDDVSDIISAYRLPGDLPLPAQPGTFSISVQCAKGRHSGGSVFRRLWAERLTDGVSQPWLPQRGAGRWRESPSDPRTGRRIGHHLRLSPAGGSAASGGPGPFRSLYPQALRGCGHRAYGHARRGRGPFAELGKGRLPASHASRRFHHRPGADHETETSAAFCRGRGPAHRARP